MTLPDERANYVHRIGRVGRADRFVLISFRFTPARAYCIRDGCVHKAVQGYWSLLKCGMTHAKGEAMPTTIDYIITSLSQPSRIGPLVYAKLGEVEMRSDTLSVQAHRCPGL